MRSPDPARRHTVGVYLAGAVLIATVAIAVVMGVALLFNAASGESRGTIDLSATSPATRPRAHLAPKASAVTLAPTTAPTTAAPAATTPPTTAATPPPTVPPGRGGALCVGDSVMQAASPRYYDVLSMCGTVDAAVSRQWGGAAGVIRSHSPYPDEVVIHMGTNGFTSPADVDSVLQPLADVPGVVLVTVQLNGTRRWEASENAEIAAAAGRWPNVRIADWKAVSDGHPEYFRSDRIHPTRPGALAYAGVIAGAL